jgi:hypothetical protein
VAHLPVYDNRRENGSRGLRRLFLLSL